MLQLITVIASHHIQSFGVRLEILDVCVAAALLASPLNIREEVFELCLVRTTDIARR